MSKIPGFSGEIISIPAGPGTDPVIVKPDSSGGAGKGAVFEGINANSTDIDSQIDAAIVNTEQIHVDAVFDAFSGPSATRKYLFDNLFHGTAIPASSSLFFVDPEPEDRSEIKGSDVSIRGSDQPHQIVYGQCRVGGVMLFITTDIPLGGEYIHFTNAIAGHEVSAVTKMYVDEVEVPFNLSGDHIFGWSTGAWQLPPLPASQINGYAFASVSDGTSTQVVNSDLKSQSDALFPGIITNSHKARGIAYVYNILYFSPDFYPQGFPKIKYLVNGHAGIYDPRTETTGYTNNAALCIGEYLSNSTYGFGGVWGDDIDVENFRAAADICDESVSLRAGGSESRYTCNGVFDTSEDPESILQKLQTTIGGPIEYSNGKWKCYPAAWRTPSITLTEGDFVAPVKVSTGPNRQDLFNGITGTYLSSDDNYEIADFPAVTNPFYENQDGEQILKDITLPFTTSKATARRLAKIMLLRHRQSITVEAICTLKAFQLRVADNVYVTLGDDLFGWEAKEFEVLMTELVLQEGAVACRILLKETSSTIFTWSGEVDEINYDIALNTTLPDPRFVSAPTGVMVTSGTTHLYRNPDGTIVSRAFISWTAPTDPYVMNDGAVFIRAKNNTASESFETIKRVEGDQTGTHIWDVQDGSDYTFGVKFRNGIGVSSDWTDFDHIIKGKEEPPSVVTGFTSQITEFGINFKWDEIPDVDRDVYVLGYGEDRSNLYPYSEAFDNAAWQKVRVNITADATIAPDGLMTASKLYDDSSVSQSHNIRDNTTVTSGVSYRMSIFAKAAEHSGIRVHIGSEGFPAAPYVDFELSNGSIYQVGAGITDSTIESVGNGWYRCTVEALADTTTSSNTPLFYLGQTGGTVTYTGDGSSGIYIWGAQWQVVPENARYVRTDGTTISNTGFTEIFRGKQTGYTWDTQVANTYDMKIYALDTSGNPSITYTELPTLLRAPSSPQNLSSSISGENIILSWEAPAITQFAIQDYLIQKDGNTCCSALTTEFSYRADYSGTSTFSISAVDVKGNIGDPAEIDVEIVPPSKVTNVTKKIIDNNVLFFFDAPDTGTLPIGRYELRKGDSFDISITVATNSKEYFNHFETLGGIMTFWIVPIDSAGNQGVECGQEVVLYNPPDFVLHDQDTINPTVADTFTNAISTSVATDEAFYAPVVTGRSWAQHFTDNSNTTIQDFIDAGYTIFMEPAATADAVVEEVIDLGVVLPATIISTTIVESALQGTVTSSPTIEYSEDDVSYTSGGAGNNAVLATDVRYIKTKYTISNSDDKSISRFSAWTYNAQVKTQTDAGRAEITANPTTVSFDLDFVDINSIVATAEGTSALIAVIDFSDVANPTDFDVYVFNTSGGDASGSGVYVRWEARGAIAPPDTLASDDVSQVILRQRIEGV